MTRAIFLKRIYKVPVAALCQPCQCTSQAANPAICTTPNQTVVKISPMAMVQ